MALSVVPLGLSAETASGQSGLSVEATYKLLQEQGEKILFIDVRDPVEIQFVGFTDLVDVNIPFLLVDRQKWISSKSRFAMERNEAFLEGVAKALAAKGLGREARIITMCRSGSGRGEPSASYLRESGYPNAYFVIHGFQGDKLTEGLLEGFRLKNGWQNSGLPWSYEVNGAKIHRPSPEG